MSYLDFPRVHFGGLFFTDPSTINNRIENYDPDHPPTEVGWNPDGLARWWLESCRVTAAVGVDGETAFSAEDDAIVGARVATRKGAESAKIVDLDPAQQMRSEIWGAHVLVELPGGGGFSGRWQVPQLHDLYMGRGAAEDPPADGDGSQPEERVPSVGVWRQRLVDLVWETPERSSPVFDALRGRSGDGVDLKLTVDLYQKVQTPASRRLYGRAMGTFGPALAGDPLQIVPGRRLYAPEAVARVPRKLRDPIGRAPLPWWNAADCAIREDSGRRRLLVVDVGASPPLAPAARGRLDTGADVVLGLAEDERFIPFSAGRVSFADATYVEPPALRQARDVVWHRTAGVVHVELTAEEGRRAAEGTLALAADDEIRLREPADGLFVNVEPACLRLAPGEIGASRLYAFRRGEPVRSQADLRLQVDPDGPTVALAEVADSDGGFRLTVEAPTSVRLPSERRPLDSHLYSVDATLGKARLLADGPTWYDRGRISKRLKPHFQPLLSVLVWADSGVVDEPTWEHGAGPVFRAYAQLYPGMERFVDLGDEEAVRRSARRILARMELPVDDPGYMPVTRDLSPARTEMLRTYLRRAASGTD